MKRRERIAPSRSGFLFGGEHPRRRGVALAATRVGGTVKPRAADPSPRQGTDKLAPAPFPSHPWAGAFLHIAGHSVGEGWLFWPPGHGPSTHCSQPRVRYDGYGPFLLIGEGLFLLERQPPKPARPLALRLFFCGRGTPAPHWRCCGGDARRLDRPRRIGVELPVAQCERKQPRPRPHSVSIGPGLFVSVGPARSSARGSRGDTSVRHRLFAAARGV